MAEPLVSIVINNYNYARFLPAAIDSALSQDHAAVEVVVVDDGSTDDSRAVIASYGDRIVAVLKENGGQGSAFNAGFAASHGTVVNFLDADDTLLPDAARRAAAALSTPGVTQWMAPLRQIDARGRETGQRTPGNLPKGDLSARTLAFGPWAYQTVPTSGNFFARWFLDRVLPMPESYRLGGDEYLVPLAGLYGLLESDESFAGCYRAHGGNAYWRERLEVKDVADDAFYFDRISGLIARHAKLLGRPTDPLSWSRRDWRQQVRRVVLGAAPPAAEVLGAVWRDQTRPLKKVILMPAVAAMLVMPSRAGVGLGLKLLARG